MTEGSISFTKDGKECYWTLHPSAPFLDSPLWKDNKPQYYIAMPIRPEQMESRSEEILREYPDAMIFKETMEKKVFK